MAKKRKHYNGDCYLVSFNYVMDNPDWKLVHGIPVLTGGPHAGEKYGHAWCEKGELVHDASTGTTLPKVLYYAFGKIKYSVSYTYEQARKQAIKTKVYGAWDKKVKQALHS